MPLSLSAILADAKGRELKREEVLFVTQRGLRVFREGADPDRSVAIAFFGASTDWRQAERDILGWARMSDVELLP